MRAGADTAAKTLNRVRSNDRVKNRWVAFTERGSKV